MAALFEEYAAYDDVCFDADCFRERLKEKIAEAVKREREKRGGALINEIKRLVLEETSLECFFDGYTRHIEIDGVPYEARNGSDLRMTRADGIYKGYGFTAWCVGIVSGRISVEARYFLDKEGRERWEADEAAEKAEDDAKADDGEADEAGKADEETDGAADDENEKAPILAGAVYDGAGQNRGRNNAGLTTRLGGNIKTTILSPTSLSPMSMKKLSGVTRIPSTRKERAALYSSGWSANWMTSANGRLAIGKRRSSGIPERDLMTMTFWICPLKN